MLTAFRNTVAVVEVAATATFESFDPFTAKPWALIPPDGPDQVNKAVAAAKAAFKSRDWAGLTATARGKLLNRLAETIGAA